MSTAAIHTDFFIFWLYITLYFGSGSTSGPGTDVKEGSPSAAYFLKNMIKWKKKNTKYEIYLSSPYPEGYPWIREPAWWKECNSLSTLQEAPKPRGLQQQQPWLFTLPRGFHILARSAWGCCVPLRVALQQLLLSYCYSLIIVHSCAYLPLLTGEGTGG
jgi:hypothetical protein